MLTRLYKGFLSAPSQLSVVENSPNQGFTKMFLYNSHFHFHFRMDYFCLIRGLKRQNFFGLTPKPHLVLKSPLLLDKQKFPIRGLTAPNGPNLNFLAYALKLRYLTKFFSGNVLRLYTKKFILGQLRTLGAIMST